MSAVSAGQGQMLLAATRPRTSLGTLFSDVDVAALRAWMTTAGPGSAALATAPTGSGLTTLVELLVREVGVDAVWIGCSTPRVKALLAAAGANPVTVMMKRAFIVVDEIEGMASTGDSGLAEAVAFAKSKPPVPVLFLGKACRSTKPVEFAKGWPRFAFSRPPTAKVVAYLRSVAAAHGVALDDPDALAAKAKGDVRSAIMAMEFARTVARTVARSAAAGQPATATASGGGAGQTTLLSFFKPSPSPRATLCVKDDADDGLDLVEAVLRGERGRTVRDGLRVFAMEPGMLGMGIYENYGAVVRDVGAAARVADDFSVADLVDRHMYARQAWDLHDLYGACSVAAPAMSIHAQLDDGRRPKKVRLARGAKDTAAAKASANAGAGAGVQVTKFGSVWSKSYSMCAKLKHLKAVSLKYAEAGLAAMGPTDLAFVRLCVRRAIERDDEAALRQACWPLDAAEVLCLARLDAGPDGSKWYKQSTHARLKKCLAAVPAPAAAPAAARPKATRQAD